MRAFFALEAPRRARLAGARGGGAATTMLQTSGTCVHTCSARLAASVDSILSSGAIHAVALSCALAEPTWRACRAGVHAGTEFYSTGLAVNTNTSRAATAAGVALSRGAVIIAVFTARLALFVLVPSYARGTKARTLFALTHRFDRRIAASRTQGAAVCAWV